MITEIDVKRIEQEMRLALHQDGLDEILVGLSLGIMAVFFLDFRFSIALIAGCIIQILVKPACRRRITYPRVGYAKLHECRDRVPGEAMLVLAIAVVVGIVFCLTASLVITGIPWNCAGRYDLRSDLANCTCLRLFCCRFVFGQRSIRFVDHIARLQAGSSYCYTRLGPRGASNPCWHNQAQYFPAQIPQEVDRGRPWPRMKSAKMIYSRLQRSIE